MTETTWKLRGEGAESEIHSGKGTKGREGRDDWSGRGGSQTGEPPSVSGTFLNSWKMQLPLITCEGQQRRSPAQTNSFFSVSL